MYFSPKIVIWLIGTVLSFLKTKGHTYLSFSPSTFAMMLFYLLELLRSENQH